MFYKNNDISYIESRCKNGEIGCTKCKDEIAEIIYISLKDFQERRAQLLENKEYIYNVLDKGKNFVREIASKNIKKIREKIGID